MPPPFAIDPNLLHSRLTRSLSPSLTRHTRALQTATFRRAAPPLHIVAPLLPELKSTVTPKIVKMTNIAGVESRPFDPDTYELEEEVVVDVDGTQRMRANDQNVIRWRKVVDADGTARVESNARFVKWSDGSVQLLLVGFITFFLFCFPGVVHGGQLRLLRVLLGDFRPHHHRQNTQLIVANET